MASMHELKSYEGELISVLVSHVDAKQLQHVYLHEVVDNGFWIRNHESTQAPSQGSAFRNSPCLYFLPWSQVTWVQ